MRRNFSWISATGAGLVVAIAVTVGLFWWVQRAPLPVQRVTDNAGLMSSEQRARVSEFHKYLLSDHDIDYRVVSEVEVGDINRFAVDTFAKLAGSMQSTTGRGLLLVIAPAERLVRLEVSHSLEAVYTDAFVKYIEERQMVPFFASGRMADGILATTELIVARVQEAKANSGLDSSLNSAKSGGGGAVARIETGNRSVTGGAAGIAPGATPQATLARYFDAMDQRNASTDLAIYTPATHAMLKRWTITPAQMDMVVKSYRKCVSQGVRSRGVYAVIRYRIKDRTCAPFFLENSPDGWQLDLTMMQKAIRFGRTNAWRFDLSIEHPYEFAFEDWRFDENGFPKAVK